jgi:hypothetical protein
VLVDVHGCFPQSSGHSASRHDELRDGVELLDDQASAPAAFAWSRLLSSLSVVSMMIGVNVCAGIGLTSLMNVRPSITDMLTSLMIKLSFSPVSSASASWPSHASMTS